MNILRQEHCSVVEWVGGWGGVGDLLAAAVGWGGQASGFVRQSKEGVQAILVLTTAVPPLLEVPHLLHRLLMGDPLSVWDRKFVGWAIQRFLQNFSHFL